MNIEITADKRGLIVKTPHSSQFVSELKRLVPASDRQFDGESKAWIVSPAHGKAIQKLIMAVYGEAVHVPAVKGGNGRLDRAVIRVEYVGQCKQRADGSVSAYGHDGSSWAYILPESVLSAFFGGNEDFSLEGLEGEEKRPQAKSAPSTLYAALLVKPTCSPVELKAAWRRMAALVHPDVNHEPDAHEQFIAVQHAYEVLSDPMKRKRYDAGLALEASLTAKKRHAQDLTSSMMANYFGVVGTFRSPLRCGLLTVDGEQRLGRVIVSRIYDWQDITREDGKTMVSSWTHGAESYEVAWV